MQLKDLETDIAADRVKAEVEAPSSVVGAFERRRPGRKPFPWASPARTRRDRGPHRLHLVRGSGRIVKTGEDITETLEVIPRQWKVIQPRS